MMAMMATFQVESFEASIFGARNIQKPSETIIIFRQ
jgi:hypothetical protein